MSREDQLQDMKGVNSPFTDSIATCFVCGGDFETASGDIEICPKCDEPVCVGCRREHQEQCGEDCLS